MPWMGIDFMRTIKVTVWLLLGIFLYPLSLFGANDGSLGMTSTGTVDVSLSISSLVQISGLSDITLNVSDTSSNATGNTSACIYTNVGSGTYNVTVTSANALAGVFRVKDSGDNYVVYTADWNDEDATGGTALVSGTPLVNQTGANTSQANCGGTPNARLNITFLAANLLLATPGTYTDTITIVVAPV